jgi:hypothetical protein
MAKLSPQAKRISILIATVPVIAATSCEFLTILPHKYIMTNVLPVVLYKRLILGEERRRLPKEGSADERHLIDLQPSKAMEEGGKELKNH